MDRTPRGNEIIEFDPFNLPYDLLAAIGLITACAAQTENIIEMAIGGIAGVDALTGWAITCHMPMPLRLSALRSLASIRLRDVALVQSLEDLISTIERAQGPRNRYVHGKFGMLNGQIVLTNVQARTHLQSESTLMTVDQIKREAITLQMAGMELMRFLIDHNLLGEVRNKDAPIITPAMRKRERQKAVQD